MDFILNLLGEINDEEFGGSPTKMMMSSKIHANHGPIYIENMEWKLVNFPFNRPQKLLVTWGHHPK